MKRHGWTVQLFLVFGMIVLSFVSATVFTQWRTAEIDRSAVEIADSTAPSIEHLTEARSEMRRLQILLLDGLDQVTPGRFNAQGIEDSRARMEEALGDYLLASAFPGEQELHVAVLRKKHALNAAVTRCVSEAQRGNLQGANLILRADVSTAADGLAGALTRAIQFNAAQSKDLAHHIRALRASSIQFAIGLDVVCAFITIAGAIALRRAVRAHEELAERHRRVVEERAAELEEFAGRIAHDILSPLGAVSLALQLSGRADAQEQRPLLLERATRAVHRIKRLVDGLLGFARAGAKPEPGAHTEVGATIDDLVAELQPAVTDAGVELRVISDVTCHVACTEGVLASVVGNLAHNAIKYIGDGPVRRLEIRASEDGQVVRVEVEDTGPGLVAGLEQQVFEPYVRGRAATQPGIGLGLATVKRLVVGHGGRVGVRSTPGHGCTFWFELPRVAEATYAGIMKGSDPPPLEA